MKQDDLRRACLNKPWSPQDLDSKAKRQLARMLRLPGLVSLDVMADAHAGPVTLNGAVVATEKWLYPELVGADIGCGYGVWHLPEVAVAQLEGAALLHALQQQVPILNTTAAMRVSGHHRQMGTLGRGNHFLELRYGEACSGTWLLIHSGSRTLGPRILKKTCQDACHRFQGLAALPAAHATGLAYLRAVRRMRAWARLNRAVMASRAIACLSAQLGRVLKVRCVSHADHNHLVRQRVKGQVCWVHRKSVSWARKGVWQLLPGSMGDASLLVRGRHCAAAISSMAHGAGRSRPRAALGSVTSLYQQMQAVHWPSGMAKKLREERPDAYRDIWQVARGQQALADLGESLQPWLVHKG